MTIHKRSKSKKLKKKKRKKKNKNQRFDTNLSHVRSISIHSNIDEIESYKEYKRRRSKEQELKKRKEQKETNRIKKYEQRQGFHRRQSKTVDFNMSRSLKHITEENVSSDDDICTLPSLQSTKSESQSNGYSFSVHINKENNNNLDENDVDAEEKHYQINTETVPLKLRQSYSLSSNGNDCSKHSRLNLAINDECIDNLNRRESKICHEYDVNEQLNDNQNKYQSLIERNKLSLLKKTKSFKSKIYESDSDGLDDCFDDTKEIKFLSQNNYKNKRRSKSFCLSEFQIDESVIEYHVLSVVNKKRQQNNKNIKINIHINNDIIAKDKRQKIKKKNASQHIKSASFMSEDLNCSPSKREEFGHENNASIASSVKTKVKKKKKHKHKRHRSKKNCSCQKHNKIKSKVLDMDRAHSSHYFSPRSHKSKKEKIAKKKIKKKDKKEKKNKQQIKFRHKSKTPKASKSSIRIPRNRAYKGSMSKTPKVSIPSAPIHSSPRYGRGHRRNESVPRFDWNGVCCE